MRTLWWITVILFMLSLLVWITPARPATAHDGAWMDKYWYWSEEDGIRRQCCGPRDCIPVRARLVAQSRDRVTVEINGVILTMSPKSIHQSEELSDYACFILRDGQHVVEQGLVRCLFLTPGS